ncbi:MAG: hypothetical protein KGZ58_03455 [Ignavibacteriales bacterium]|nr:hypothetical protein [Ignavibacteriales bacterium]
MKAQDSISPKLQHSDTPSLLSTYQENISITNDSTYKLSHQFIEKGSEVIFLDSTVKLQHGKDYTLDYRRGNLHLLFPPNEGLPHSLSISYKALPYRFKEKYFHRELIFRKDTLENTTIGESKTEIESDKRYSLDNLFGNTLQKSGSIARGFTLGTNKDFSLQSEFQLQLNGQLSDDISLVAALSDNNIPIQPEGNTQTLSEIDKVYIEVFHPKFSATLGDFDLQFSNSEFGSLNRKLQGAKANAKFQKGNATDSLIIAAAISRGKFTTNDFAGIEGVQGPYRLFGKNNERNIIIIAGSERVYVNGEIMLRGDGNDFTIDYSTAELTFTSRRLITSVSRIVVDFEYSDRKYSRNSFAARTENNFFDNHLNVALQYYREGDDFDAPLDVSLSDSDKAILRNAGNNREQASKEGWRIDSLGNYVRVPVFTGMSTDTLFMFRYKPDTVAQKYSVTFSFVGSGSGDYERKSIGVFEYVGKNLGSYLPKIFLPLPELHQIGVAKFSASITDSLKIESEFATSNFDENRFSTFDDNYNTHTATKFSLRYDSKEIKNFGRVSFYGKNRIIAGGFVSPDRIDNTEYFRKWNMQNTTNNDEFLLEGNMVYSPSEFLNFNIGSGNLSRGVYSSTRKEASVNFSKENLPMLYYNFENINRKQTFIRDYGSTSSSQRQKGNAQWNIANIIPSFRFENEIRKDDDSSITVITLSKNSFRFNEFAPKLSLQRFFGTDVSGEVEVRNEDSVSSNIFSRASKTVTQKYFFSLYEANNFSSSVDGTIRDKKFTNEFLAKGNRNIQTTLLRWQGRYAPFNRGVETNWLYEATSERSAKPERVFLKVKKGTGNYLYLGDRDSNGIVNDADFSLTRFDGDYILTSIPSDALFPVVDVRTNLRIRLSPVKIFSLSENLFFSKISSESFFRLEEKNSSPTTSDVYFLRLSKFLGDSTIAGNQQQTHDLFWNEGDEKFSLRFRFQQRKSLAQLATTIERGYNRERSIRLGIQLDDEIGNQTDFSNVTDKLSSTVPNSRVRDIAGNAFATDFSYRPKQQFEFGFKLELSQTTNHKPQTIIADMNSQSSRFTYSFESKGQVRMEFTREEVQLSKSSIDFPYQLTNGKVSGISWLWKASYDYRITDYLQSSATYDGRKEGTREVVHTARAEVRAVF